MDKNSKLHISQKMISVIVPVYNVEKWLRRCLDSILAQTFTDFELLLIDDGSTDGSGAICEEYATRDPRIRVFHKPNGGVSSARNVGLDNARGVYIVFVDSDDWIAPQHLDDLLNESNTDLRVNAYSSVGFDEQWEHYLPDKIYRGAEEVSKCLLSYFSNNCRTPWCKRFRANIIQDNNIRFNPAISMGEDIVFVLEYLEFVKSISLSSYNGTFYYRGNDNSLSRIPDHFTPVTFMREACDKVSILERKLHCDLKPLLFELILDDFNIALMRIVDSNKSVWSKRKELRSIVSEKASQMIIHDSNVISKGKLFHTKDFLLKHHLYLSALLFFKLFGCS